MENASKALIIAGGVLIAILVITLLVVFYDNLKVLMSTQETVDASEQVLEFNKQYDAYYRNNIYGSELLSLVNKAYDYNKTEYEEEGYSKMDMQITFKTKIFAYNSEVIIDTKTTYTQDTLREKVEYLEENIQKYGKEKISGKTVEALSGYRTNELQELFSTTDVSAIQTKINLYLSYKSALTNLKSKTFNATKFEYDNKTARVKLMVFKEN